MYYRASLPTLCMAMAVTGALSMMAGPAALLAAQASSSGGGAWVVPRTPDGHPDLQGNWSSATLTPFQRPEGQGPAMSLEDVQRRETRADGRIARASRPSDPNRPAPPFGGDGSTGGAGNVGGYNGIYMDQGTRVAVVDGVPLSSLITFPADGRVPPRTPEAEREATEYREYMGQFGRYDHPEVRPLGERCIVSFGRNIGPPMLPNGAYNNNYTIVQTADHVVIMAEMVHDARIIRIGDGPRLPPHVRPWMGDSWGRWEGDVLVVETTNINPVHRYRGNASDNMKVVERFSRVDEETILYEFTIDDPTVYTSQWGGVVPMKALHDRLYEYACHEGNYALSNILSGARYQERRDEEASGARD